MLVLVVVCALLAGGLWWKLKNAQLSKVMVKPEQKMTNPACRGEAACAFSSGAFGYSTFSHFIFNQLIFRNLLKHQLGWADEFSD